MTKLHDPNYETLEEKRMDLPDEDLDTLVDFNGFCQLSEEEAGEVNEETVQVADEMSAAEKS